MDAVALSFRQTHKLKHTHLTFLISDQTGMSTEIDAVAISFRQTHKLKHTFDFSHFRSNWPVYRIRCCADERKREEGL